MRDIIYTEDRVSFDCECCGSPIVLKKHSPETVKTSVICTEGNIRYWIKWSEGILRKDPILAPQQLAQNILDRISSTEEKIKSSKSMHVWTTTDVEELFNLKQAIKELCQEEMNKQ